MQKLAQLIHWITNHELGMPIVLAIGFFISLIVYLNDEGDYLITPINGSWNNVVPKGTFKKNGFLPNGTPPKWRLKNRVSG